MSVKILATGSSLPELCVPNSHFESIMDTSDEWIVSRTGIKSRHIASHETTATLGEAAARAAMYKSGLCPGDIGLVIFATITPTSRVPSMASLICEQLDISRAIAFDINAACTGFIYACTAARAMMESAGINNALIIGAETLSTITDYSDRTTAILFADGAGAAVLGRCESGGILAEYISGEPDSSRVLYCDYPAENTPFTEGKKPTEPHIMMNGKRVFVFAIGAMTEAINAVLQKSGLSADNIKWIVPHQANTRIIKSTASRMEVPLERFFINLDTCGNTSSASIPIALDQLDQAHPLAPGDRIILVGFGGGLTYGAILIEW